MVDWSIARRVAGLVAREEDRVVDPGLDLVALGAEFTGPVSAYTQLDPATPIPQPELVSRRGWADANFVAMAELMRPAEERMSERFDKAGPLAGPLRTGAGAALAAEIGLVVGYMSQRVLGQYELSLIAATASPRLLFVGTNLVGAAAALNVDRDAFVRWVTVHELTHAMQFGGVPWLRDYMGGLLKEFLEAVDPAEEPGGGNGNGDGVVGRLRGIDLPDPATLAARFREGGIAALIQNDEQREVIDRMQAAMAVVEGHAEHVMDALAPELVPQHAGLRAAMDARRQSRSAPERFLLRLLGMEMKLRQYKVGKEFCDAVVAQGGIAALNQAWVGPEALPTLGELEDPAGWLARQPTLPRT